MYKSPNVKTNQNICEIQNSGSSCGIPPLSAPITFEEVIVAATKIIKVTFLNIN